MKRSLLTGLVIFLTLAAACGPASEAPEQTQTAAPATQPPAVSASPQDALASVLFVNVGRADAALVKAGGKVYLIDTGEEESIPALYRALAMQGVNRLDGVFLTHPHDDHIGGLEAVAQRCEVGTLYSPAILMNAKKDKIAKLAEELALPHSRLSAGDKIELTKDVWFEVLGPIEYNEDDDNDNSLVMRLTAGETTVLFTGDMQFAEENSLLAAGVDVSADVLKVGNHGNPDASSETFIDAVGALIAVISTDTDEDEDTPAPRVLAALDGVQVHVTQDYPVGVLLKTEGKEWEVSSPQPPVPSVGVSVLGIDKDAQTITLVGGDTDYDLSGCFIISLKGGEVFIFPQGAVLRAGQTLTVACRGGSGEYIWDEKKVWSDSKKEAGVLYDAYGNELSRAY